MKIIRYIFFIPFIFLIVSLIYNIIPAAIYELLTLSRTKQIVFLIFFGAITVGVFQFLPVAITWLSAKISPSKNFAFYSILVISVVLAIMDIYEFWSIPQILDNGLDVLIVVILTCLIIGFATSLSVGAGLEMFEKKEGSLSIISLIGFIIFYIGIFFMFCLLTSQICDINPDKSYSWYSGILHGIFVIPNWIVSLFSDDFYCKAPKSTIGYSIWWWITFIFIGMNIFSFGNSRTNNY
jgi:hypothetical protein